MEPYSLVGITEQNVNIQLTLPVTAILAVWFSVLTWTHYKNRGADFKHCHSKCAQEHTTNYFYTVAFSLRSWQPLIRSRNFTSSWNPTWALSYFTLFERYSRKERSWRYGGTLISIIISVFVNKGGYQALNQRLSWKFNISGCWPLLTEHIRSCSTQLELFPPSPFWGPVMPACIAVSFGPKSDVIW